MKSCPTCQKRYADTTMRFCLDDGALLSEEFDATRAGPGAEPTLHLPGHATEQPVTAPAPVRSTMTSMDFQPAVGAASSPQVPAGHDGRSSRGMLWVIIALIIGGSGIAIALIITRGSREPASTSSAATPTPGSTQTASPTENASPPAPKTSAELAQADRQTEPANQVPKATPARQPTPPKANAEEPTAPPINPAPRGPISGGVMNGKATYLAKPAYPPIAKAVHAAGAVSVQVLVSEEGNVISASAVSGHPLLRASAVAAARASKFSPTKLSGQPVKVSGVIVYNFVEQ